MFSRANNYNIIGDVSMIKVDYSQMFTMMADLERQVLKANEERDKGLGNGNSLSRLEGNRSIRGGKNCQRHFDDDYNDYLEPVKPLSDYDEWALDDNKERLKSFRD